MLDVVATGLVEPMSVVDDKQPRCAAAQVLVDSRRAELHLGSDVAALGHRDHPVLDAEAACLGDEPFDQGGFADAGRPVDDDHDRLPVDCGRQPPRQLGALRDSPDDVDHP